MGTEKPARPSERSFAVAAPDTLAEYGGFTLDADDHELLVCIDDRIDWLTDDGRIGYAEWRADPTVFRARVALWPEG